MVCRIAYKSPRERTQSTYSQRGDFDQSSGYVLLSPHELSPRFTLPPYVYVKTVRLSFVVLSACSQCLLHHEPTASMSCVFRATRLTKANDPALLSCQCSEASHLVRNCAMDGFIGGSRGVTGCDGNHRCKVFRPILDEFGRCCIANGAARCVRSMTRSGTLHGD